MPATWTGTATCVPPVLPEGGGGTAWRLWGVRRDGSLTMVSFAAGPHFWRRWDNIAKCSRGHPAPAERCFCGLHVILDEAELWKLARRARGPLAAGPVVIAGRVLRSEITGDPPSTRRVERVSLMGPLVLSPRARPYRDVVAARYGLPVTVEGWGRRSTGRVGTAVAAPCAAAAGR